MPDEKDPKDQSPTDAPKEALALDEAKEAMDAGAAEDAPQAGAAGEAEDGEGEEADLDAARPEAIAKRVAALGEDDDNERLARAEEAKLATRRKELKKGKRGGLEAAASKRLSKIGTKAPSKRAVAVAADMEPVADRAVQAGEWAKKNQNTVIAVVALAVLALGGYGIYGYLQGKKDTLASIDLAKAVADERGRIGDPDKEDDPDKPKDPRPVFKTAEDRRDAALKDYRDVEAKFPGTGAAFLSRLSEGSILLDKRDVAGALAAFTDVNGSPLAQRDAEVRGRALEGQGFAYELKAETAPDDQKGAALDEALKVYKQLENTDVDGFKELGMYHQARVDEAKGDKAKAIELLRSLHERIHKPDEAKTHPFPYLQEVADDRLRALDPSALPPKTPAMPPGAAGGGMDPELRRRMIEALSKGREGK